MPFNRNGLYYRRILFRDDAAKAIDIQSGRVDEEFDGLTDAINQVISGMRPFTGAVLVPFGTEAAPGLAFDSDSDTGIHRSGSDKIAIVAGGKNLLEVSDDDIKYKGHQVLFAGERIADHADIAGGYVFYARPDLTLPDPITANTDVALTGHEITVLDAHEFTGEILAEQDFTTEWFGGFEIDATWTSSSPIRSMEVTLTTEHNFNGKSLSHSRAHIMPWVKNAIVDFPMNAFNSVSQVMVGTYTPPGGGDPIEITEQDLLGPVTISYKIKIRGLDAANNYDPFTIKTLTWPRLETRSYQVGIAANGNPGQRIYAYGGGPEVLPDDLQGRDGDVLFDVTDETNVIMWDNIEGTWVRVINVADSSLAAADAKRLATANAEVLDGIDVEVPETVDTAVNAANGWHAADLHNWRLGFADTDVLTADADTNSGINDTDNQHFYLSTSRDTYTASLSERVFLIAIPDDVDPETITVRGTSSGGDSVGLFPGTGEKWTKLSNVSHLDPHISVYAVTDAAGTTPIPRSFTVLTSEEVVFQMYQARPTGAVKYKVKEAGLTDSVQTKLNRRANAAQYGSVILARPSDVDVTEVDTSRVLTVDTGKTLIARLGGMGTPSAGSGISKADARRLLNLEHLTRDIHVTHRDISWNDAAAKDGDMAYFIPVNNAIAIQDSDFDGGGNEVTVPASSSARNVWILLRIPVSVDVSDLSVYYPGEGTRSTSNYWNHPDDDGITGTPESTTHTYWVASIELQATSEFVVKFQKRDEIDHTRYDGTLGDAAQEQVQESVDVLGANVQRSIAEIQHLTRDIHDHEHYGDWETAADSDGDLYEADISRNMPTLTDALFNNQGATLTIDSEQNDLTQVYIRIKKGVNRNTLQVVLNKGKSYQHEYPGNKWFDSNFQKPTSKTYDYFEVVGFQNGAGTTIELQKRDATSDTTSYTGMVPDTRLADLNEEPDVDDLELGDIVVVDGAYKKLAITDETEPNVFTGTVGSETIRTTGGREIRGIIGRYHPNGWTNDGEFSANPNGATEFIIADNERRLQWAVKQSEYVKAKGSAFAETDKLAIKLTLESTKVDEVVGAHYNTFSANVEGADTAFLIFSHRMAEGEGNYNLFSESAGTSVKIEYFAVDSDGNATTTPFLTHVVKLKHLIPFIADGDQQLSQRIQENAGTIESLKSNIQRDIDSIVGLSQGAAFVTDIPDPDTYADGTKVILTEDVEVTVGNKTEVKYGQGVYGLADKPEDAASNTKKWMSFIVGSGPDYRGFAEGFAGVTNDPLGDARPQYAYPPDTGNAVVSPLGDAIASFREHRGLVSGYDVAIITIKKAVYWELLQEVHGSTFGSTTTPSISEENFVVRMVRTDTGAVITNADEVFWFSRGALASLGETVTIAGVDYFQLYYSGDTRWFDGIPGGTECLLTLEHRHDTGHHAFDESVSKAWSRLDRHDPVTNELARLNGRVAELESTRFKGLLMDNLAAYNALATKDPQTVYYIQHNNVSARRIYLGDYRIK